MEKICFRFSAPDFLVTKFSHHGHDGVIVATMGHIFRPDNFRICSRLQHKSCLSFPTNGHRPQSDIRSSSYGISKELVVFSLSCPFYAFSSILDFLDK
ncbi:hypothetical protein QL285_081470 [Trifolium repens]|nr:hypothetical protein QL285_081470 [Trifolium repens]